MGSFSFSGSFHLYLDHKKGDKKGRFFDVSLCLLSLAIERKESIDRSFVMKIIFSEFLLFSIHSSYWMQDTKSRKKCMGS